MIQANEGVIVVSSPLRQRELQDQSVCQELRGEIVEGTTTADIQGTCECSTTSNGDTRLACGRDNLCLSSDGGDPMQGDFQSTFTKDGSGLSFTQRTTSETCFTYPDDMKNGTQVCVSSTGDDFGTVATCQITVDGQACNVCRYCPINLISFDCTNLGYEDRTACGDSNADDSIIQFLYKPQIVTGCPAASPSPDSAAAPSASTTGMFPTTTNPTGAGTMANIASALMFSLLPVFLVI